MAHPPTYEQQAIIDAACSTSDSLIIDATPGSGKTSTLEMVAHAMPVKPILCVAFNKRIVEEMSKRLPDHCKCQTANSIGHRAWSPVASGRLTVSTDKTYKIVKAIIDGLSRSDRGEAYEILSDIRKAVSLAKVAGYIPEGIMPHAKRLVTSLDDVLLNIDGELNGFTWIVDAALKESIRQSYAGNIDFDDQIYMPTLFGGQFPKFPDLLLDEVQDFSQLNREMIWKLFNGRMMAVGDPRQSIYAFRGAMTDGMAVMKRDFGLREMPLSISFRCPKAIVERARFRAPHMKYPDWAKEGAVRTLEDWNAESIPDGAAIVCRNNAPLFATALQLLKNGRGVQLVGFDIGPNLVRALRKLGPESMTQNQVLDAVDRWESEQMRKSGEKKAASIVDRADCLRVFARNGDNLTAAIAYAEGIFKSQGPITLLSGHKSKGLEWDHVFHLDPWRIPSKYAKEYEEREQELNLRYVIETRPKDSLYLVKAENFT